MSAAPLVERLPLTILAGRRTGSRQDREISELVERVAELTAAGDQAGAARARLQVAYTLRNADRWQDAAEAAEEAVRSLDRVGLDEEATRCRYLLWELYRRSYQHRRDALAALDGITAAPAVPADLPAVEVLLEEAADLLHTGEAADRLFAAAERHRARECVPGELRTLRKALAARVGVALDDRSRRAFDRADLLASAHGELPAADLGRWDAVAARIIGYDGRHDEALDRIDRAIAFFDPADLPEEWVNALLLRARLLLVAGRSVDAEAQAREVLTAGQESAAWTAGLVVAKALRAQDRGDDAHTFMSENGIDEYELDDVED